MPQSSFYGQAHNEQLLARNDWFFNRLACIPNTKLDAVTKLVVLGISQEFVRKGIAHSQLMKIWYPNISDHSGLSLQTVNGGVTKLVKAKAIIKETKYEPDKITKEKKKRVYIAFTPEFLSDPCLLFVDVEESNYGGKRTKRHKGCGGEVVNLCTKCQQSHIPETEIYYADDADEKEDTPPDGREMLERLDALIDGMAPYYDASEIDDDVVDSMGGAEKVLAASPGEIARHMAIPRHIREGLDDDDLEAVINAMYEMKGIEAK